MSAIPKPKITVADYLALDRRAEFKSEYLNGEMFALAGASRQHNELKENLIGEIFGQLKGGRCRSYSSDQRVKVRKTGLYTYPDFLIVCGEPEFDPEDEDTLINPQVIFEILSDSTESYDRGGKFRHYRNIESMKEYVLVSQWEMMIERYVRETSGKWSLTIFEGPAAEFALESVPVRVAMSEIYRNVKLEERQAR